MNLSELPLIGPLGKEVKSRLRDRSNQTGDIGPLADQWRAILKASDAQPPLASGKKILFVTGYGLSPAMLAYESVLMMALRERGSSISSLYCNASMPACEFNATGNNVPDAGRYSAGVTRSTRLQLCDFCVSNVRTLYSHLPIELYGYERFLDPGDSDFAQSVVAGIRFEEFRDFEFEGVKIGEEAFASVLRVTLCGTVEDTPKSRWLASRYLYACLLMSIVVRKACAAIRPDRILATHGVYATHGIATKVANSMGIPVIIFGFPYRKNTIWLAHDDSYHRTLMTEPFEEWVNQGLTPDERQVAWDYLISRQAGRRDYVTYHPNPVEDVDTLYSELGIDRSRRIISLFTNVIWDAQIYYNSNAFVNIFEWVSATIRELGKNEKVWLVIRIHPAEVKGGLPTKQPMLPEINKLFPQLPSNVRIIPPESNLSSYTLAENSRAALIYGTKMGLEIAARGVPVLVCGETFNRGKGFTIDIESQEQYRELLAGIQDMEPLDASHVELALNYTHYLFFRKMIDFTFVDIQDVNASKGITLKFETLSALQPGKNAELDVIMEGILDLKPLHLPPGFPQPAPPQHTAPGRA